MSGYRSLIGKLAPSFKLKNYDGKEYDANAGESGLPLVIFFYPESGSFHCTRQACQFRDAVAVSDLKRRIKYGIGRGMWGLVQVVRVTFVIDRQGIVGYVVEGTMNYGAHAKFVEKWLETANSGEAETVKSEATT
ncbi:Peroxiredoxin Q, chloroplastic [Leucoagaricus sp. SymC.cos]|nr:Peroxiredoxin Q, chloroplastic [Leucoagaricus sp. SymC.cos]